MDKYSDADDENSMTENGNHDKKKSDGENLNISTEKPVYLKKGKERKRKSSKPFDEEPPKSLANIRDEDVDSSTFSLETSSSKTVNQFEANSSEVSFEEMFLESSNQIAMETAAKNQKVQSVPASNTAKRNE